MEEEWKIIQEFPDYAVSNSGRIKRATRGYKTYPGRIISASVKRSGYAMVTLMKDKKQYYRQVHRLVAEAFVGDPAGMTVNHKDGIKAHNHAPNLEYLTQGDNNRHASRSGLRPKGEERRDAKLKNSDIDAIIIMHQQGLTGREIGKMFGVSKSHANKVISGQRRGVMVLEPVGRWA